MNDTEFTSPGGVVFEADAMTGSMDNLLARHYIEPEAFVYKLTEQNWDNPPSSSNPPPATEPPAGTPGTATAPYNHTYGYDTVGNITSFNGTAYTYGNPAHVHAVTAAGANTYTYDANGNMITRTGGGVTYTQSFDAENRLVSVTWPGNTVTYVYDANGQRVKHTVNLQTTKYIGNYYEVAPSGEITKYYYFGNQRIAERRNGILYYLYVDHLGSTSDITDASGVFQGEQGYFPFGSIRYNSGAIPTDFGFTGQRLDSSTGLMYYGARYYDAALGRFIQADTIVPNPGAPQNLNRYSYVLNNPLRYTNPGGHYLCEYDEACHNPPAAHPTQTEESVDLPTEMPAEQLPPPIEEVIYDLIFKQARSNEAFILRLLNLMRPHTANPCIPQGEAACLLFSLLVFEGHAWDAKRDIAKIYPEFDRLPIGNATISTDTPGNIVFGFVGREVGFTLWELLEGAGVAQLLVNIRQDRPIQVTPGICCLRLFDYPEDQAAISLGSYLYHKYGLSVTPADIAREIQTWPGIDRRPQ